MKILHVGLLKGGVDAYFRIILSHIGCDFDFVAGLGWLMALVFAIHRNWDAIVAIGKLSKKVWMFKEFFVTLSPEKVINDGR